MGNTACLLYEMKFEMGFYEPIYVVCIEDHLNVWKSCEDVVVKERGVALILFHTEKNEISNRALDGLSRG